MSESGRRREGPLPERNARGREAEQLALEHLLAQGFRLLWQNLRLGALELDLVAQKDDLVVVVEVRSRGPRSLEKALASISPAKRRTLLRAVDALWRTRLVRMPDVARVRIDVAAVTRSASGSTLEWIAGAITQD